MQQCRFSNCHHDGDKGCAVEAAIADGQLSSHDWQQFRKLEREAIYAQETEWEKRARFKKFSHVVQEAVAQRKDKLGK